MAQGGSVGLPLWGTGYYRSRHDFCGGRQAPERSGEKPASLYSISYQDSLMNKLTATIAFWASAFSAALFVVFIGSFVGIAMTNPLFVWTNLSDYVAYTTSHSQSFKYLAQTSMLLFGPAFIVLLACVHEMASADQKVLTRIALANAVVFAALIGIHYFIQISAVRLNISRGHFEGIEQFLQGKPDSAVSAINMLGWTLFFGLSSLFVAPVFKRSIRWLFIINGVCCLLAGIGYVFENIAVVFFTINLGMGGCVTILSFLLAIYFRRIVRQA
jgi:hypothetical protein